MHGRSCAIWNVVRIASLLTEPRLSPGSDQRSKARPSTYTRSEPSPRNSLSLSREDCPLPGHLPTVDAPGLSLRFVAKSFPSPFDPPAPPRHLVSPRPREINAEYPLPGSLFATPAAFQLYTPAQGLLNPSRSKRQAEHQPKSSPNQNARFPSLPAACCF
jgi:hypothetical protein